MHFMTIAVGHAQQFILGYQTVKSIFAQKLQSKCIW